MALIICPECKRQISETASSCPNCGYQLTPEIISEIKEKGLDKHKKRPFLIFFFSVINWAFGVFFLLTGLLGITESLLGCLCLIIISLLLLPPVRNYVYSKTNKKITLWQRVGLIFILFIAFGVFAGQSEEGKGQRPIKPAKTFVLKFVYIPAGEFTMGSNDGESDEKPVHNVTISKEFRISQTEVTVGQYLVYLNSGGDSNFVDFTDINCPVKKIGNRYVLSGNKFGSNENQPMVNVSWHGAQKFCEWLSRNEGKTYRLPTEAEWEYACRADSTMEYSFVNSKINLGDYAWFLDNSDNSTHPVGQKKPNAWGLYDMHGNVWEWCLDWYDENYYFNSPGFDPQGPTSGKYRVLRGGAWAHSMGYFSEPCRSAIRDSLMPDYASLNFIGFRVVSPDCGEKQIGNEIKKETVVLENKPTVLPDYKIKVSAKAISNYKVQFDVQTDIPLPVEVHAQVGQGWGGEHIRLDKPNQSFIIDTTDLKLPSGTYIAKVCFYPRWGAKKGNTEAAKITNEIRGMSEITLQGIGQTKEELERELREMIRPIYKKIQMLAKTLESKKDLLASGDDYESMSEWGEFARNLNNDLSGLLSQTSTKPKYFSVGGKLAEISTVQALINLDQMFSGIVFQNENNYREAQKKFLTSMSELSKWLSSGDI